MLELDAVAEGVVSPGLAVTVSIVSLAAFALAMRRAPAGTEEPV